MIDLVIADENDANGEALGEDGAHLRDEASLRHVLCDDANIDSSSRDLIAENRSGSKKVVHRVFEAGPLRTRRAPEPRVTYEAPAAPLDEARFSDASNPYAALARTCEALDLVRITPDNHDAGAFLAKPVGVVNTGHGATCLHRLDERVRWNPVL